MSTQKVATVDASTGAVLQHDPVFTVAGIMPVVVASSYMSDLEMRGPLGWGRIGDIDAWLIRREDGRLAYRDGACLDISFAPPTPNPGQWNPGDHIRFMEIAAGPDRTFMVREEGLIRHFAKVEDKRWHLTAIENAHGLRLEFERDDTGLLTAIAMPEGLRVEFDNDADSGLRRAVHLVGRDGGRSCVMRYDYDGDDNLTLADCPFGARHEYRYDDRHLRIWARLNGQYEASYTFDAEGRCVLEETNGPYNGTRFDYDPARRITKHTPAGDANRAEYLYYGEDGAVFAEGHIWGPFNRSYYDDAGNLSATQDGLGHRIKYTYDPRGYINSITDPEGRISDFRWSEDGQMEYAIDHSGATWESTYDEFGALIETKDALGHDTMFRNNEAGQPTGLCRHDGYIRFFDYDVQHWLTRMVDFDGIGSDFERDEFGRVTAIVREGTERTEFEYEDQEGFDFWTPTIVHLPGGHSHETRVIEPRRHSRQIDASGRITEFLIDAFGKVEETRDAEGGQLKFTYDTAEELSMVENQTGQRWTFERDAMGRMVRETDFGGATITYNYDDADRLIGSNWPDGTRVDLELDKSGLIIEEVVRSPGSDPLVTSYDFDERALMRAARNEDAEVSFERDAAGQVVAETSNGTHITSEYDCCGRRSAVDIDGLSVAYAYDPAGRLMRLTVGDHAALEIGHDALGHERLRQSGAGFSMSLEHDALGLLTRQVAEVKLPLDSGFANYAPETRTSVKQVFAWNKSLEPTSITHSGWGERNYRYTRNGQVVETVLGDGAAERFRYDETLGVAASEVQPSPLEGMASAVARFKAWQTGPDGRVEEALGPEGETVRLTYDAKGRVVERTVIRDGFRPETWHFEWNGLDRMVAAHTPDGARWTYGYDAFARRVFKQEWRRKPAARGGVTAISWTEAARHDYLWDGDVMVRETITVRPGAAPRVIHWIYMPDSFVPLAREEAGRLSYVICDHLGTPQEVVAEDGTLEWAGELATWGRLRRVWVASARAITTVDPDPAMCPIRFQGQWADAETGLSYNRHRYYCGTAATYLSPDPLGALPDLKTFSYVDAPSTGVDALGLYNPVRVPYGGNALSLAAMAARSAAGHQCERYRNYAAARVCGPNGRQRIIVRSNNPGGLHSEELIANALRPGERVIAIYSERIPCTGRCQVLISRDPRFRGARTTYTWQRGAPAANGIANHFGCE